MVYDECQLWVVQIVIMKMYITDTDTTEKMWAGESALFVCKQFEVFSIYLALDIMHYSLLHISQLTLKWKCSKKNYQIPLRQELIQVHL